jgi:hypothetical protein
MLTPFSFDRAALVTVKVGKVDHQKEFMIHEGVICARSEFFKRAMNGIWTEAKERVVNLLEDRPDIFEIYVNHVYTNQLPTTDNESDAKPEKVFASIALAEYVRLAEIYVLAERLRDRAAKNAIVVAIIALFDQTKVSGQVDPPGVGAVQIIFNGTLDNNPARQLMVDFWLHVSHDALAK